MLHTFFISANANSYVHAVDWNVGPVNWNVEPNALLIGSSWQPPGGIFVQNKFFIQAIVFLFTWMHKGHSMITGALPLGSVITMPDASASPWVLRSGQTTMEPSTPSANYKCDPLSCIICTKKAKHLSIGPSWQFHHQVCFAQFQVNCMHNIAWIENGCLCSSAPWSILADEHKAQ